MKQSNNLIKFALIAFCLTTNSVSINLSSGKFESKEPDSTNNRYITKISGGVNVKANETSWNVAILGGINTEFNQGAIISPNHILTNAVFCSYLYNNRTVAIKYGGIDRTNLTHSTHNIKTIFHPKFTNNAPDHFTFNFCILRLNDPVKISTTVKIIPIAKKRPIPGTEVNLTSWGYTSHNDQLPNNLQLGSFKILSTVECQKKYREKLTDDKICAQAQNVSTCYDDWGAPLVVNEELVGIVSTVAGCYPQNPSVFEDTVFVRDWILSVINGVKGSTTTTTTRPSSTTSATTRSSKLSSTTTVSTRKSSTTPASTKISSTITTNTRTSSSRPIITTARIVPAITTAKTSSTLK